MCAEFPFLSHARTPVKLQMSKFFRAEQKQGYVVWITKWVYVGDLQELQVRNWGHEGEGSGMAI